MENRCPATKKSIDSCGKEGRANDMKRLWRKGNRILLAAAVIFLSGCFTSPEVIGDVRDLPQNHFSYVDPATATQLLLHPQQQALMYEYQDIMHFLPWEQEGPQTSAQEVEKLLQNSPPIPATAKTHAAGPGSRSTNFGPTPISEAIPIDGSGESRSGTPMSGSCRLTDRTIPLRARGIPSTTSRNRRSAPTRRSTLPISRRTEPGPLQSLPSPPAGCASRTSPMWTGVSCEGGSPASTALP